MLRPIVLSSLLAFLALTSCSSTLAPYDPTAVPVVSVPLPLAGIADARGRFREIFCTVLETRRETLPDYEPCESALVTVGTEPAGTGEPVALGSAGIPLFVGFVPGIGWTCFRNWLEPSGSAGEHLRGFGYDGELIEVDGLSSSATNAGQIRDWVLDFVSDHPNSALVLFGYSKGAPDVLQALVDYPEIVPHVAAVVSAAGSVGGSPLANYATQDQLELLTHWPGADCDEGDGMGLASLSPQIRQDWLASNPLPSSVRYYSLVTFPNPDRISNILEHSYRKLAEIDGRNDGQVVFDDQFIPRSTLIAFVNADHWALSLPIGRSHSMIGRTFVDHNDYPREALLESVVRLVEEDLERDAKIDSAN
jgi:hypothetical protein